MLSLLLLLSHRCCPNKWPYSVLFRFWVISVVVCARVWHVVRDVAVSSLHVIIRSLF